MKPTLTKKPEYNQRSLLVKFAHGEPLTADELNFLDWHAKELSNQLLDPVSKYYLKIYQHRHAEHHSFLLPHEILNKEDIARLKKRLQILVADKKSKIEFSLSAKQYEALKKISYHELMLYHGNHFLTGAPYHPGGIPHVVFFQWGNLFGVAKYVVMAEEKSLKSNVLIYIEDSQDRYLHQCVEQYVKEHEKDIRLEQQHQHYHHPQPEQTPKETYHSPFAIPELSLSPHKVDDDRKK